jgi:hypothetical protein
LRPSDARVYLACPYRPPRTGIPARNSQSQRTDLPMGIWKKLFGSDEDAVDYYNEGVELLKVGKYHEALTSFRLAQRGGAAGLGGSAADCHYVYAHRHDR